MKVLRNIVLYTISVLAVVIFSGCSKDDLTIVKTGYLGFDKSKSVGQALDGYKYFGTKEWLTTKTPEGARLVIFKADMNPLFIKEINEECGKLNTQQKAIESQKWSIQFTLNSDNTFHVSGTQTLTISTDKKKKGGSLNEALLQSVYKNQLAAVCM